MFDKQAFFKEPEDSYNEILEELVDFKATPSKT